MIKKRKIKKKKGKINEYIYNKTTYENGVFRHYPTLMSLNEIITGIIEVHSTTKTLYIMPFYRNMKKNQQIEFDKYLFFMECKDSFTLEESQEFSADGYQIKYDEMGMGDQKKSYVELSAEDQKRASILSVFNLNGDYESYAKHLRDYREFLLNEAIPEMFEQAMKEMELSQEDLAYGYFCFEIHSS